MAKKSGSQKISLNQELLTSIEQLNEEKVASFLEKGADPDMRNKKGDTLLNIALSSENISPKIVELLVENGAHLNYVSSDRVTPLMCAVYNIHVPTETVSYLLQAGASVYSRDTYGQTPLLYATGREDIALVDLLLTYGANVNETDADGNTLLFEAVRQGYENLFSYLVDQGADLTVRDYQGATLLMSAIENKQEKMAHLLLQFPEIDILATRVDGLTALDMVHDLLNETENSSEWKELSETLDSKVSERLSFFDELSEGDSNDDDWADWDEETEEESFVEVKDPIGDGFDDVDFEEEMVLTPSSDNHLSEEDIPFVFEEDETQEEEDIPFVLEEDDAQEEEDLPFVLEGDETQEEEDIPFVLEEDDAQEEEDVPFVLEGDEDVQGFDDDAPTYQEVVERVSLKNQSNEEPVSFSDDDFNLELEDEEMDEEEDVPFVLESDEDVQGFDDDEPTYQEVVERVSPQNQSNEAPVSVSDEDFNLELEDDSQDEEEDVPFVLEGDEDVQGFDDDAPTYQEVVEYVSPQNQSNEEPVSVSDDDFNLELEDEEMDEEEDIPFVLESDEDVQGFDDDEPTYQEVVERVSLKNQSNEEPVSFSDDDFNLELEEEEMDEEAFEEEQKMTSFGSSKMQATNPYDTENMDPWTYFETEKNRVVSRMSQVNASEMSKPLNADEIQTSAVPQNNLPLYSEEVYQHAAKMIKKYTEYQSENGEKGVYISGVYLTNKACSQARVHIERMLLEQGYLPQQAHEQSVVLLYKLIRANGLYHPKEFVLLENGEKSLAFKVWGCDHRVLLKSLTSEFAPTGNWYESLHKIESYVGEKGEGKLSLAS
ncbi:MAG: ankyrin repeat domain-containing protein [Alphaproteobacteria bacterium]|nr:ankyrin repeat domain-containing protein [Alphaproteobacteria bacterium]